MNYTRTFYTEMKSKMAVYKKDNMDIYKHILPARQWTRNLWSGIRQAAVDYFKHEKIQWHKERDNLLSSQILCVNIFFPLRNHPSLLDGFLKKEFYKSLAKVTDIDFEYIGPKNYFNELRGGRGYNRTSADVAITWKDTKGKNNLLLVEFKFTEPNFGECSKSGNLNQERCDHHAELIISSPNTECYRSERKRKYWDIILSSQELFNLDLLKKMPHCPFRYDFYQLMRNQLLAKCIAEDEDSGFSIVEFAVCYDGRNETLLNLSHPIDGHSNPFTSWKSFLKNPSSFKYFTIQQLLEHIGRTDNLPSEVAQWRAYLNERYGL